ncbi:peptide chain release factor 1 [Portibacter marinus]|uniref:peptide chain release factor 1 n=1 Tax=Portibacter marinus TaxID=2898660 RepID=UPI001F488BF7|nr:peptide chain release factor 1 [Portibacter marinus]
MFDKLESIHHRFKGLEEQMADPEIISDQKRFMKINKEYKDLKPIDDAYHSYKEIKEGLESAEGLLNDKDPEMREMAKMELENLKDRKEQLDEEIKLLLIPKDPDDDKNAIMEIRAGTGGDEASIFAGDLHRMYMKYFETMGWKTETLYVNEGSAGGFSKISVEVKGEDVYGKLKFESGAHRVQRVPKTESQGRVHTSAATVAIMPIFEMEDIDINKADLKVDTFRASGAGGQHVNKTESGVRFTHLPTGIVAESTDGRSQIKNREIAMGRLYQKIREVQQAEFDDKVSSTRKSLVGSGDRSDKIRTYNYPQNRVTDHRINLTLYSLDKIIEGSIEEIIEALQVYENTEKMKEGLTI